MMESRAVARHVRVAPRKARQVIDLIRDKPVGEARAILEFSGKRAAEPIAKVLKSAVANATHNHDMDETALRVVEAFVDEGVTMRRMRARARGMAATIRKRTSHITIVVGDGEEV